MEKNDSPTTKFPIQPEIVVRFADVDILGHVNHAKFFTYMEEARIAYLAQIPELDFIGKSSFAQSVVLASVRCDFLASGRIGDRILASIGVTKLGRKSIEMTYRPTEKTSGKLLARGVSTIVMFDFTFGRSIDLPDTVRQRIAEIEGAMPPGSATALL